MTSTDIFIIDKTIIHRTKTTIHITNMIIHITKNSIQITTKITIHIKIKRIHIKIKRIHIKIKIIHIKIKIIHKTKTNIQLDINKCSKAYVATISKKEDRPKTFYKIRLAKRGSLMEYRKD
jgi:hypothetical protein